MENIKSEDLFSRTWKTVAVLVGACVLFVGALSGAAVLITSRAFDDGHRSASPSADSDEVKADMKDAPKAGSAKSTSPGTVTKKPVSI